MSATGNYEEAVRLLTAEPLNVPREAYGTRRQFRDDCLREAQVRALLAVADALTAATKDAA